MDPQNPIHDISGFYPTLHLPGGVEFPTYFIITSLSFVLAILWLVKRADHFGTSRNRALDLALVVMMTGFAGSRLFHVFFEEPNYYWQHPMRIFEFWMGGFVWYGGALAGGISALIFLRLKREPLLPWLDLLAPVASLGYALGRFACLATGCCFGEICVLPNSFGGTSFRHPTQLYAIVFESAVLVLLLTLERKRERPAGQIFFIWLVGHSIGRIVMEYFRADPRGPEPLGISIATWISFVLIAISLFFLRRSRKAK
jgi:phosphatidylglycerol:prolipoprotein diacylglycerol transferase